MLTAVRLFILAMLAKLFGWLCSLSSYSIWLNIQDGFTGCLLCCLDVYAGSFCWLCMLSGYAGYAIWIFILAILAELAGYNLYTGSPSVYAGCAAWLFMLSMLSGSAGMLYGCLCLLAGWLI
jgi:hypothetical protein